MIAACALMNLTAQAAYPELCLGLGRPISAVRINIRRRIGFVQKPIEFLTVMHARVGHVILPDQLVPGIGIDVVLVSIETLAVLLGPARILVFPPRAWKKDPSKNRQKDKDARWTKKHGKSFYGYKNHVNADARHKLIRQYDVTDASVHDSQKFDGLLNKTNTSADVYADSAYRSAETEAKLRVRGLRSQIHQRASRNHPLSKAQENANRKKSKIRARVEHVFGAQQTSPGGRIIRTIGIARAKAKIGLQNLAYNIRRLVTLERMAAA